MDEQHEREALYHRKPPGGAPRLSAEHRAQWPELLAQGAEAYGFVGQVWTTERRQDNSSGQAAILSG